MINFVIFGGPGSGKGTQSDRLIDAYGLHHISTGEVLRAHIAADTDLGKTANSFISKGQLIPDELMIKVLASVLDNEPEKVKNGVIFDGFPRTIPQAKALAELLGNHGSEVSAVIGLEVPDEELVERMLMRGKLTGRADDNIDTIRQRLEVYHNQTSPLREYYISEQKYLAIDGSGDIDSITERIHTLLADKVPGIQKKN